MDPVIFPSFTSIGNNRRALKIFLFVSGTGTGVGKTLLAGFLFFHLRSEGKKVIALKPFCCGGEEDLKFLGQLQGIENFREEICHTYFPEPLAPYIAGKKNRKKIKIEAISNWIHQQSAAFDWVVIEGCGGLLVPLGKDFFVLDLIQQLNARVFIAAPNMLGVLNHSFLTFRSLQTVGIKDFVFVLMGQASQDLSAISNREVLRDFIGERVVEFPFFGSQPLKTKVVAKNYRKIKKSLAQLVRGDIFTSVLSKRKDH